ncbi:MAG: SH3 domain-containing protein, partial [Clostridia bacterium]
MKRFLAILLVAMLLVSVVPATSMAATQYATVVGGWLRLRSSPSYSASTITSYYTHTQVKILSTSGSWCKVETPDGKTGYMYSDYLKLGGSSGGGTGGGTGGGIGTATVTSNNGYGVHLRKGPGTAYRTIRTIAVGTPVTVLERGSSWSKLNVNGTIGYMMNKFLNRGGESGGDEGIICYATIWSNNGYGVRVRTGPGTGYDRIGVYSVGTTVGVISQGATWDYIRVGSRTGYIMNKFLNYYASNKVTSVALNNLAPVVGNILAAQGVTPSQATVSYSWLVGGVEAGTAPTYLVTNADIGKSIQLKVTGTGKYTGSATSTATNAVLSNTQIIRVDINGMLPVVGDKLSATITPANATAIYTWLVDGKQMSNAKTYLVTAADTGKEIQLIATGTGMFSGTVASLKTARVSASGKLANARIKNISTGNYANGESPNAGDQLLAEINPIGATVRYSWKVNNVEVSTANILPVQASWAGSVITLRVDGIGTYTGYSEDQTLKVTSLMTVTDLNLKGLTAPKNGDKPVSAITESTQFTGAVSWLPADATFQPGKTYTATVGLNAKNGYTFTGVAQNAFKVEGAPANVQVTNAVNKGTVTVVFPTTGELPISNPAIGGVTVPVANAAPVTAVTATSEYTGTVSWSPSDAVFKPETEYTATITLKPQSGYTVAGIRQDWFTVAGAAATNATNGNVITARFPKTGKIGEIIITTGDQLQGGTVNQAYSVKLTATGAEPIVWSITKNSLPVGLMLDTQTGIISGTPQAAGNYTFEITATNAMSTKSKSVSLAIAAVSTAPVITTQTLPDA